MAGAPNWLFLRLRAVHIVINAGDEDVAAGVLHLCEQFDQAENRVGSGAAVEAGVKIASGSAGFDFHINQSAQADVERGQIGGVHFGIGDERYIGFELRGVLGDIFSDGDAADFLFAFDEEFDIDRQGAVDGTQGFDCLDVGVYLAFVIGRTACVEVAIALGGFEGRRFPEFQRIGRLNVEVSVAEYGRLAGRVEPICVDQGWRSVSMSSMFSRPAALSSPRRIRRRMSVFRVFGKSGNAGNAEEFL